MDIKAGSNSCSQTNVDMASLTIVTMLLLFIPQIAQWDFNRSTITAMKSKPPSVKLGFILYHIKGYLESFDQHQNQMYDSL
jgi:hypothetical protein